MSLPLINTTVDNVIYGSGEDGRLLYQYSPFQNLKVETDDKYTDLDDLTMQAFIANIDVTTPISLDAEVAYDGSVNLIVNDFANPPKIVNSRFYLIDSNNYKIADRKGNLDTNIYTEENFKIEAGLIKSVRSIISVDFLGIDSGGIMNVGNYTFYFKLADSDGNQSDFVSESGKIICHVGSVNDPTSIRGGQHDESSDKVIKFRLNNLDLAYDYINIYYTRSTGDDKTKIIKTYQITDKFEVTGVDTEFSITGYESHVEIDNDEINIKYASFDSAKSNENCQDITFIGNITKDYEVFETLEKLSLLVTPSLSSEETIGNLNYKYKETYTKDDGYEYYNAKNIYSKLGYWDDEIYRAGIVYIMNDYTLSPVFNTRGIKELKADTIFNPYTILDEINVTGDYLLEESYDIDNPENSKGVFKINNKGVGYNPTFSGTEPIRPIGLKFNFTGSVTETLKLYTKGFFIVRQKRIPTLLAQGVGVATSKNSYFPMLKTVNYLSESFLTYKNNAPFLKRGFFEVTDLYAQNNAILCPEATMRPYVFNNFFNSSEFTLKTPKYKTNNVFVDRANTQTIFNLDTPVYDEEEDPAINSSLLLVEPGIELINNGDVKFSSKAGNEMEAWTHLDPIRGDINNLFSDPENEEDPGIPWTDKQWSDSTTKVRGEFNTYVGSSKELAFGEYYNIFQKDYDFDAKWKDYYKIRYNDSSPFMAINDRTAWEDIESSVVTYRGDCYINTYSHRMNWNFIDPELPTNTRVVDPWNWYKNYKVKTTTIQLGGENNDVIIDNTSGDITGGTTITDGDYKKVLPLFTWKDAADILDKEGDGFDVSSAKIVLPDGKKFDKYSEANGTFGTEYLNRPDINGVPIGHWATFKVCSNVNLAMRDIDFSRPEEESVHGTKRKFHPLQKADSHTKLPESKVINTGISSTLSNRYYYEIPDVPFIKDSFTTRIHYSNPLQETAFKNGHRVFKAQNFQDYTLEHGELVKLIDWYGRLIAVMEHGVLMIPVNERAMMQNASGEDVYINTENVLPKNPKVLSSEYGSIWGDGIMKTHKWVYGIDTVGKKIWRTNGDVFELISDMKIQKFLNDNISLLSTDDKNIPGSHSIKTHYNAYKNDVMFVFKYNFGNEDIKWHLCYNELLNNWSTRYTWFPEFSENINNIFYTFANKDIYNSKGNTLYKHGFAGNKEELGNILPTLWYDTQEPFEYEFVVIGVQGVQKIFDNLKIISNLAEPDQFYYEVVGEGYDWEYQKKDIFTFTTDQEFIDYLIANPTVKKVPYIKANPNFVNDDRSDSQLLDVTIKEHNKTKEKLVQSYQKGSDIHTQGRIRGNMEYVEDLWDVQIQPIRFKYAYLSDGALAFSNNSEMKIRDKYIKIRVRYDGTQYAIINALRTFFTISYA